MPKLLPGFEIVHIVTNYYDGILDGTADYRSRPHDFSLTNETGRDDVYRLTPLSDAAFGAVMECFDIWCRWVVDWDPFRFISEGGDPATIQSCRPEDLLRKAELEGLLERERAASAAEVFLARAEFERFRDAEGSAFTTIGIYQVRWTLV